MNPTGILFSLVAGGDGTILVEFSRSKQGSIALNAKKVFNALPKAKAEKRSYNFSGYCYNMLYETNNGTVYMCVTEEGFSRVQSFTFMEDLKKKFSAAGRPAGTSYQTDLRKSMEHFSDPKNDKFAKLKSNIEEVKGVMIDNIEKIIERGERIERVVDKTEELAEQAGTFQNQATTLNRKMWKKGAMLTVIVVFMILILIMVIVLFICGKGGINFKNCGGGGGGPKLPDCGPHTNHTCAPTHPPKKGNETHPPTKHPETKHPETKHPETKHPETKHPETKHPETKHPGHTKHQKVYAPLARKTNRKH